MNKSKRATRAASFLNFRVSRPFYIDNSKMKGLMLSLAKQPLIQVSCINKGEKIGLVNYSDLVVFGKDNAVVALRIGGYPEAVQAMSDIVIAGCDLELKGARDTLRVTTKGQRNYEHRLSHDGIYAEAMYYLKDDVANTILIGDENSDSTKIAVKKNLYFFCNNRDELFAELDRKLSVPLIPEFKEYFISALTEQSILEQLTVHSLGSKFEAWHMKISEDEKELVNILEDGLRTGKISVPGNPSGNVDTFKNVSTFTEYLHEFGKVVADRIKKCFMPKFDPSKESISPQLEKVNECVHGNAGYSLFDAQLGAAEALKRQLETDKMALLVAECGTGKTKIGSAALYAYQHSNSNRKTHRKAFNAVICPSHITEKWVREIHETIPNSYAMHVSSIAEVNELYNYYLREDKSVYCVLSKETARNGYMRRPAVRWNSVRRGFECPYCGYIQKMAILAEGECSYTVKADAGFFLNENSKNHKCQNKACKEVLWSAVNTKDLSPSRNQWVRIGGYGFIHRRFAASAYNSCTSAAASEKIAEVMNNPYGVFPAPGAIDRYPLSSYIKKKIRRIDGLIIDELHQYSGESAQGQAMAELAGIANKVIGMTATLVNGYAKGIFYLLFRLKSRLMMLDGQKYNSPRDFCHQYGVVEEIYSVSNSAAYNSTTKAVKRKVREKFLPGISPIVYSRFLLENAVFLSLADMGKELPDYEEIPVFCTMSDEVHTEYSRLENEFKKIMKKQKKIGNRILSSYMNLLSAYPDQPYGHNPVYNPFMASDEDPLITPKDIGDATVMQPKDEQIIKLIERKVSAGENVIVYTAWTRLDSQDKLFKALNERDIPTVILKPSVATVKREAWVEKQLQKGIRVLITNPALVETGLDLNAFTTLIFYNIAYNLYIFRQASRRSWRINQTALKIEVYMFYYINTMQQRALRLMASKLSAATVIEGNISDEGLAALSECEDLTTQLAKELMAGLKENATELADSFKKMAILGNREQKDPEQTVQALSTTTVIFPKQSNIQITKPKGKNYNTGQLSLFDLVA